MSILQGVPGHRRCARDLYAGILGYSIRSSTLYPIQDVQQKEYSGLESFRNMLHICPRVQSQTFAELPFEEEILDFIRFLGHGAIIRTLTDVNINKLYQPWRSFAAIINKCLTGKSSGYDSFRLSQAQILWGLYHKINIDYAFLIWEDFVYQVKHKNHKKSNEMYYPRFTKVIIHHFMSKDPSIPRINKVNWHYVRDDFLFSTINVVSRNQNTQQYGAMLPIELTNDEIRNTKAYKDYYAFATGEAVPKPKANTRRKRSESDTSITPPTATLTPKPTAAATPRLTATAKGKQPAKATKAKSPSAPSEVSRTKAQQLKIILRRSRQQTRISQPGGSGTDEGTGSKPGVPDVPTDESEEELSWNSSDDEGADDQGGGNDEEEGKSDEEDDNEETKEEESFNLISKTPKGNEDEGDGEEDQGLNQESSSVSSQFVTSMLNPTSDIGMESIFATASSSMAPLHTSTPIMTPSTIATITTISQAPIPPTPIPSEVLQNLPTFASVFRFDDRLKSLEANFSEYRQTNPFAETVSNILGIVHQYMNQQMNEAIRRIIKEQVKGQVKEQVSKILPRIEQSVNAQLKAEVLTRSSHSSRTSYVVADDLSEMELKKILIEKMEGNKSIQCSDEQRNLYKALVDAYEADKIILDSYGETVILKRRRDDDDDDQDEGPSAGSDRGSKRRREGKEPESASAPLGPVTRSAGRSTTGSKSQQVSTSESAFTEEPVQTTSPIEEPSHPVFEIGTEDQPIVQSSQHHEWFSQPKKPPTSDRDWNKTLPAVQGSTQTWISELAKQTDSRSFFNELLDTPLDFSNFIMNRLRVDTLTPELLAGPTFELMKGSCQQYPHNLLQPLPLIPDNRGRRVIPFVHFINNDLEYLWGGAFSRKYTTSVTKTKAADYGQIKWIKDLVPRTMWIQEPIDYDKHALWGVSHWGRKRQQFYDFAVNRESALDVYSKRRIIALSNLTVEERFTFNVSLRMFTRSIVIQRRVEDLQLGVESYQKRLNLTKPDTYRSDLKQREAYTTYSNPRGFIYQNKDKKNRYHFIKEQDENGVIKLYFINTEYQLADLFTKSLGRERIEFLINKLGMRSFTPETLKQLMKEEEE
nr:ribonuclease H [Tanacetum cinerariifolium]